jgi:putative ABC transport system substrate-binding protein
VDVPIVFVMGWDPVVARLVESYAKPGGRLTGIHYLSNDLTGKRFEILKEILPKLRKVVTFYDPSNETAMSNAISAREAARQLKVEFIEKHVASAEELNWVSGPITEADAYFVSGTRWC